MPLELRKISRGPLARAASLPGFADDSSRRSASASACNAWSYDDGVQTPLPSQLLDLTHGGLQSAASG